MKTFLEYSSLMRGHHKRFRINVFFPSATFPNDMLPDFRLIEKERQVAKKCSMFQSMKRDAMTKQVVAAAANQVQPGKK